MKKKTARNTSDHSLTTRNDFNPVYVISLILDDELTRQGACRILEEACHVIVKLRDQQERILAWQEAAPWS